MDVFKPFLQRLSQPIVLAFCISWIFWNWEIVVSLLWYSAEDVSKFKNASGTPYDNHIQYIESLKDPWKNYWWPLIFAGLYPIAILILNNLHTFFKTYEEKIFFWISKKGNVNAEHHLDMMDKFEQKEKRIAKFIMRETDMQGQINQFQLENKKLKGDINLISDELKDLESVHASTNDRMVTEEFRADEYLRKSAPSFLIGKFYTEVFEKTDSMSLNTIADATLLFTVNKNNKIICTYDLGYGKIISEVTNYAYDLSNDFFTLSLKLISVDRDSASDYQYKVLRTIIEIFMNSTRTFVIIDHNRDSFKSEIDDNLFRIDIQRMAR